MHIGDVLWFSIANSSLCDERLLHLLTQQVWNLENMLPIQALQRHEGAIHSLALWHDTVFTGSEDQEIKVSSVLSDRLHMLSSAGIQVFQIINE